MFQPHRFLAYLYLYIFISHFSPPLTSSSPAHRLLRPPSSSSSNLQIQNTTLLSPPPTAPKPSLHTTKTTTTTTTAAGPEIFPIPNSALTLALYPQGGVSPGSVESILLTADSWVARKISVFGPDGPADVIWEYGTGEKPYTRLIVWSFGRDAFTWGQLRTMIDGLWLFLVDMGNEQYTYWEVYDGEVGDESQIGAGTIVDAGLLPGKASVGAAPLNITSKKAK